MTANKGFKKQVRTRVSKTGESYTAALQHLRDTPPPEQESTPSPIRIAVVQMEPPADPTDRAALERAGRVIRSLMDQAHEQGAALIHFGEGAICAPDKRMMSSNPHEVAEADWSRFDWHTLQRQLQLIAEHAAALGLWTVIGATHRVSAPHRPHNSLYVIDDHGRVVTRYDERMLSFTKVSYMYHRAPTLPRSTSMALASGAPWEWSRSIRRSSWPTRTATWTACCSPAMDRARPSRCRSKAMPAPTATGSATPPRLRLRMAPHRA